MAANKRGILIAGNWKMFKTRPEAENFFQALEGQFPTHENVSAMICAGYTLLSIVTESIKRASLPILVAAQNMESREEGAYTGEVSPLQLKELEVNAVVLGHSERRSYYNESDEAINAKALQAMNYDILPIICVGETLEQRECGKTDEIVRYQVSEALKAYSIEQAQNLVIAYEPVWAIGTGKVCEAGEANRVCGEIREEVATRFNEETAEGLRILYGGSMKPENAKQLLEHEHIDGGLIGGASLTPESFKSLVEIAIETCSATQVSV